MTGLKRSSLLALAFRPVKKRQYYSSYSIHGGYYQQRISLPNGEEAFSREHQDGTQRIIPILPVTLENLGLKRLPNGKIVNRHNGGEINYAS
jgi:hypothetical protein